jgi:hypothetical protein
MSEQAWVRLRVQFPRGIDESAVRGALSTLAGLSGRGGITLGVFATHERITHFIEARRSVADELSSGLQAAIPSLRLVPDETEWPQRWTWRERWRLSSSLDVIRCEPLPTIAASLLSTIQPGRDEVVCLCWHLYPSRHPLQVPEQRPGQRELAWPAPKPLTPHQRSALSPKLREPTIPASGEIAVYAATGRRARHLGRRPGTVWRSLRTPVGVMRRVSKPRYSIETTLGMRPHMSVSELAAVIGWPAGSPDIPGLVLGVSRRLPASIALSRNGRLLGTSEVAGTTRPVAITPTSSTRGLYLLGPTGTGKTSLIKNLVKNDMEQGRGLAVVDTNSDLITDLLDLVPEHRIDDVVLIDPTDRDYAVGFNPLAGSGDSSLVADQIVELLARLWKAYWGPRTAQIAHMTLLTLAQRSGSTVLDVPRLLTDQGFRAATVGRLDDPLGLGPDWSWFAGLSDAEQGNVTAPLRNKLRQFTARPSIRAIVGQARPRITMRQIMGGQRILLVNLPKGLIGSETSQLIGCLALTSLWQAATERAALPVADRRSFGLYVDEVQDFAAAPIPWAEMFSQGRKYGLALTVAHQNMQQIDRGLLETILANARSKAVFALSATDARVMERLFAPSLRAADLMALDAYSIAALVALDDGSVARPVTLATPPVPESTGNAARVREASRANYARPRAEVEAELRQGVAPEQPVGPVGQVWRPQS